MRVVVRGGACGCLETMRGYWFAWSWSYKLPDIGLGNQTWVL